MKEELQHAVGQYLDELGFDLVELRLGGTRARPLLEIRIDRRDARQVTVENCAAVSRALEARLDAAGLLSDRSVLQVSSPGERPLRTTADWQRFAGQWANVLSPVHGGRFEARIVAAQTVGLADAVELELESGEHRVVPLEDVKEARLAFRI